MNEIKNVGIDSITPYEKNAKGHPEDQVKRIAASIREFGFNQPIVTDTAGVIIVGHGRYEAAKMLGLDEVPVIKVSLTADQAKAYRLADNKLNESDWDMKLVIDELKTLDEYMVELTGFSKDLLVDEEDKDDAVPSVGSGSFVKKGDVWKCGDHRLMCGDSTDIEDVHALTGDVKVDMVFTDPPYNVNYKGQGKETSQGIMGDNVSNADFDNFLDRVFANYRRAIKDGGGLYVFHSTSSQRQFEEAMAKNGLEIKAQLIWNKPSATLGMNDYRSKHEPFFYAGVKGAKAQFYGDRKHTSIIDLQDDEEKLLAWVKRQKRLQNEGRTTVWTMRRESVNDYVHPTQKPVELITYALFNSSKEGDIVLDLFGGSGSTMIACEKTGRVARTMELDPRFVETMLTRYAEYSQEDPVRESDGTKWSDLYEWKKTDSEEFTGDE